MCKGSTACVLIFCCSLVVLDLLLRFDFLPSAVALVAAFPLPSADSDDFDLLEELLPLASLLRGCDRELLVDFVLRPSSRLNFRMCFSFARVFFSLFETLLFFSRFEAVFDVDESALPLPLFVLVL